MIYHKADRQCDHCLNVTGPLMEFGDIPHTDRICAECLRGLADQLDDAELWYGPEEKPPRLSQAEKLAIQELAQRANPMSVLESVIGDIGNSKIRFGKTTFEDGE